MAEHEASRTLVKSAPELWAECSDAASLARHLGRFGEIRITKLDPETAVAWEGDDVSGTVTLEPSGWGTRVTLTASVETARRRAFEEPARAAPEPPPALESEVGPEPEPPPALESEVVLEPAPPPPPSFVARLLGRLRGGGAAAETAAAPVVPEEPAGPEASPPPEPSPRPPRVTPPRVSVLVDALESLGSAHRRPFSRS
jgi:hypothetical protein